MVTSRKSRVTPSLLAENLFGINLPANNGWFLISRRRMFRIESFQAAADAGPYALQRVFLHLCGIVREIFQEFSRQENYDSLGRLVRPVRVVVELPIHMQDGPAKIRLGDAVLDVLRHLLHDGSNYFLTNTHGALPVCRALTITGC